MAKHQYVKKIPVNRKKNSKERISGVPEWVHIVAWIIYPFLFVLFTQSLALGNVVNGFLFLIQSPGFFLLNVIFVTFLGAFFWGLIGNRWLALTCVNALGFFLAFLNRVKMFSLGTGVSLDEINIFKEEALMNKAGEIIGGYILMALLFLLILYGCIFFMRPFHVAFKRRLPVVITAFLLFLLVFRLFVPMGLANGSANSADNLGIYIYFNGGFSIEKRQDIPSKEEVEAAFDTSSVTERVAPISPNIVMLEIDNFWDLGEYYSDENNPLATYQKLKTDGNAYQVEVAGENSSNLNGEYETLIGLSKDYFPEGSQISGKYFIDPTINMASILDKEGYKTYAVIPYKEINNQRDVFYTSLQFDDYRDKMEVFNDEEKTDVTDETEITDGEIIGEMQGILQSSGEEKVFLYGHLTELKSEYSDFYEYEAALAGVGAQIDALYNTIAEMKKPTIIVIYSNAMPILGADNSGYVNLGYVSDTKQSSVANQLKLNQASAVIWDNYTAKGGEVKSIDLSFLPETVLTYGDFNMPNYFYFVKSLREDEKIEAFNKEYLVKDGAIFDKTTDYYKSIADRYQVIANDVLGPYKYIENGGGDWLVDEK